jgi:hypothetical protein
MAQLNISDKDLTSLRELRDRLDGDITASESRYMKQLFTDIRAIVSGRILQAEGARERETMASHRKELKRLKEEAKAERTKQQASA